MKLFSSSSSAFDSCWSSGEATTVVGKVMFSGTEKSGVCVEAVVETLVGGRTEREGLGGRLGRGLV